MYYRSSTTAASSASSASKEPNNNEETLPPPDDATSTVEDHLHHHRVGNTVNSQSSDSDLGSTDEVKVFNDEDEPDTGDLVSESCYQAELQAEKSSLIHESEQVISRSFNQETKVYRRRLQPFSTVPKIVSKYYSTYFTEVYLLPVDGGPNNPYRM